MTVWEYIIYTVIAMVIATGLIWIFKKPFVSWIDRQKINIEVLRENQRRKERIWPVVSIKVINGSSNDFNIDKIGLIMYDGEKIPIPSYVFGKEVSFTIPKRDNKTYIFSILPTHYMPQRGYFRNEVEKSIDSKDYNQKIDMMNFNESIKKYNGVWNNIKRVYIEDAMGHHFRSGIVPKKIKQAFGK